MTAPLIPVLALVLVFGLPYLVIYLQSRRLAGVEAELRRLAGEVAGLSNSHGRNSNA